MIVNTEYKRKTITEDSIAKFAIDGEWSLQDIQTLNSIFKEYVFPTASFAKGRFMRSFGTKRRNLKEVTIKSFNYNSPGFIEIILTPFILVAFQNIFSFVLKPGYDVRTERVKKLRENVASFITDHFMKENKRDSLTLGEKDKLRVLIKSFVNSELTEDTEEVRIKELSLKIENITIYDLNGNVLKVIDKKKRS